MGTPETIVADRSQLPARLGDRIEQLISKRLAQDKAFHWALPGGSAAKLLSDVSTRLTIDWSRVHLYWGDERAVPLETS